MASSVYVGFCELVLVYCAHANCAAYGAYVYCSLLLQFVKPAMIQCHCSRLYYIKRLFFT
jgi:hypothetical protein